jgi:Uncharacterised nucleotidyltransferase
MAAFEPTAQEALLLNAALNTDGQAATASWEEWTTKTELEQAPLAELRLIPAVYAHLSRVAPEFKLPNKLRGKARAVFTRNNLLAREALPLIAAIDRHCPVMLTKGLAICVRFDAWSSRPMADVDIQVPLDALARTTETFAEAGWTPAGSMTLPSLVHRVSLRRNSWNFAKGRVSVDLHWRLQGGPQEDWLNRQMWESAETFELPNQSVRLQSPEFSVVTALGHGFAAGEERGNALQTIVDGAWLLPSCKSDRLFPALTRAGLLARFATLLSVLDAVGLGKTLPSDLTDFGGHSREGFGKSGESSATAEPKSATWRQSPETAVLRRPLLYRLWETLGRRARMERLLIRWAGPFSKPLAAHAAPRDAYDLQDCRVMDELAGPGWSWSDPIHRCFWSDRADARLLVPLNHVGDHLLVLGVSDHRIYSANPRFDVFANGSYVTTIDFPARLAAADCCLLIPRRLLFGPWVELSLRPSRYRGGGMQKPDDFVLARSVPARDLRVLDLDQIMAFFAGNHVPPIYLRILKGEEGPAAQFARIKAKIDASPLRRDPNLPSDFDPVLYVLAYPDLFENEVDPYHHFLAHGRNEGRPWR